MPAARRKKSSKGASAGMPPLDPRHSLTYEAAQAFDEPVIEATAGALSKGAQVLSDGGNALGGLARAGLRAVNSDAVAEAARAAISTAGNAISAVDADAVVDTVAGVARSAVSVAGDALTSVDAGAVVEGVASVAGEVLSASADVAGEVLGAVVEGVADSLS